MPMYEYRCEPCDHAFEALVRSSGEVPTCPRCRGAELTRQFSVPAAARSASAGGSLPVCQPAGGPMMGGCGAGGCGSGMCGMN